MANVSLSSRSAQPLSAAEECALNAKEVFKECAKCPEMVVVPAGSFTMGSPDTETDRMGGEEQHSVTISRAFAIGRFAVTFAEWDACVADGGCNNYRPNDEGWGRAKRPVIHVSWNDTKTYLLWLSRKTGKIYRLLSEAEREYVTRAGRATPYWWGLTISQRQANYGTNDHPMSGTLPVDSFQPNPWGLYQVHGNVQEWAEDCYHKTYDGAPSDGSAWTGDCEVNESCEEEGSSDLNDGSKLASGACVYRVLRGGSGPFTETLLRAAARNANPSSSRAYFIGFRVARTLTQ